ncbi:thyroid adenoma-associated protein homolog [Lingula anatina]|uniref:tRNA (32-2'-O)-methyltransferase regulator THADA n=1 Tax=Lingula anatina TaxID=7574 RepID=A0A1S3J3Z6_LINAN|nr:thyroid adenoma-associated protein homolog [Lingula anatina]|eukprot:XP_013405137.1 thyroid adenoma-associated protein homolog [Lingula anatina]
MRKRLKKDQLADQVEGDGPCETDISRLICGFLQEEDEKQQISIIKQITAAAKTADAQTGEVSLCIQVLVNAYLHMAARIPKKRALVSCLQCFGSIFKEEIKDTLKEQICSMLLGVGNNPALKQIRDLVDMLHSLSENFPIGELCVLEIYVEALEFLARALKQFHQDTEINKSPIERKERMHDIMTAVQSVTKIGQKCLKPISLELYEGRNKASLLSSIKQICESVTDILADDTFLLDCRVTCGIAVPLIVKICCDTEAVAMVINLISPNVKSYKLIENQSGALLKGGTEWLVARFSDALNRDTLPLVSYACLCHGVLAVLTEDELLTLLGDEKCLLVDVLFAELETFCNRMSDATTKLIVSRTLVLWTTRACSILASLPANMQLQFQGNYHVSDTLLQYVWTHWENPIDAVKHQSKVIFENCIKLHLLATKEDPRQSTFLVTLAEKLIHSNKHLKGKYASLSCLVEYVGTKALIKVEPNLCQDLLEVLSEQAMASHASELLEKLFIDHQMELDCAINVQEVKHLWLTTWVDPVLEGLCTGCKQLKTQLIEYVLPKLLRAEPYCVQYVITTITKQKHQGDNSSQLGALMTCLKRAKSIGILKTSPEEQEKWNEVVPVFVLRAALCHSDDQVRLDALGLLCENPKTTETINSTDFELVKFFLPLNMNSQSPAFRQTMLAFLKRFLCRVKESGQVLYRTLKCKKMESSPATKILELYKVFLHWLLDHIFSCLHPGAAFSRRTTALGALTILTEILSDQHKVQTLLECLVDTFEDNKRSALKVLSSLSTEQMGMQNQEKAVEILTACLQLVYSTKPQDCTTAAYLMKLVLRQDGIYKTLLQFLETFTSIGSEQEKNDSTELDADKDGECPLEIDRTDQTSFISEEHDNESHFAKFVTEYERAFQLWLEILLVHLSRQIETARRNLLHAAATGPLYPVLHCVRLLLDDMDLRSVALPEKWKKLLEQLLNLCFKVSDIVLPVVSHSSPEGNIPEDEDILSSGLTEGTTEDDKDDLGKKGIAVKLMPEYLVVCCWRCVKEASLLLGQLTQTAPIKREEDAAGGLLSFQQILSIGEYFKKQLLESIHRGAFELAYAGFIKMCHTLWR